MVSAELVDALQWVALAMTLPLFLAPIEPMVRIYKARSVGSFSPAPYLFACVNCLLWIGYALPAITPDRTSPLVTNVYGLVMELIYCGIFIRYAGRARAGVAALFALVTLGPLAFIALCALAIDDVPLPKWPEPDERNASNALGIAAAFFNILMYAAPLSVMRTVIRTRSVEFMPLSLMLTCGLCSTGWTLYALCKMDPFIGVPNACGAALALLQGALYACYCRAERGLADEALLPAPIVDVAAEPTRRPRGAPQCERHRNLLPRAAASRAPSVALLSPMQ